MTSRSPPQPPIDAAKTAVLLVLAFLLLLADKIGYWLPRDLFSNGLDPWVLSGWLIDYSSGFVRRGLSGELTGAVHRFLPAELFVASVAWATFLLVTAGYLRLILRVWRQLSALALLGLLFLPSLLPFYLYDHLAFGRKEVLGFLFVLWHLLILERCCPPAGHCEGRGYLLRLWPLAMLALPVHALLHEGTALWFGPTHGLLTLTVLRRGGGWGWGRALAITLGLYLPLALTLLIVLLFGRGSPEDALIICRHWQDRQVLGPGVCSSDMGVAMLQAAPAIHALGWTMGEGIRIAANALPPKAIALWLTQLPILAIATLAVGGMASRGIAEGRPAEGFFSWLSPPGSTLALLFFLLPLLLPAPIYIVAHDLGRWFTVACLNFAMLSLSPQVVGLLKPRWPNRPSVQPPVAAVPPSRRYWLGFTAKALFLLLCVTAWYLPHCCAGFHILQPSVRTLIENAAVLLPSG